MTKTVADLAAQIASALQLDKAAGWDPVGLQFGDPAATVSRIAVCHEVTPPIVEHVIAEHIDMVVAYHPLLFKPVTKLLAGPTPDGLAFQLISNGIALLVTHTGFDIMRGGTADSLAAAIGLQQTSGFGPGWGTDVVKIVTYVPEDSVAGVADAMAEAGAGRIGRYSHCSFRSEGLGTFYPETGAVPSRGEVGTLNIQREVRIEMGALASLADRVVTALVQAHPYEEPAYDVIAAKSNAGFIGRVGRLTNAMTVAKLADRVRDQLGGMLRVAGSGVVTTVAVVPGSGGSLLPGLAADVVVTGDVSHHQARAALAAGMAVIDPGHAATERPGVKALYAAIAEMKIDTIDMTDIDSDPWKGQ